MKILIGIILDRHLTVIICFSMMKNAMNVTMGNGKDLLVEKRH